MKKIVKIGTHEVVDYTEHKPELVFDYIFAHLSITIGFFVMVIIFGAGLFILMDLSIFFFDEDILFFIQTIYYDFILYLLQCIIYLSPFICIYANYMYYKRYETPIAFYSKDESSTNEIPYYRVFLRNKSYFSIYIGKSNGGADPEIVFVALGLKKMLVFGRSKNNETILAWCPYCKKTMSLEEAIQKKCPHCNHKISSHIEVIKKRKFEWIFNVEKV